MKWRRRKWIEGLEDDEGGSNGHLPDRSEETMENFSQDS
jgi:hypothetical protein